MGRGQFTLFDNIFNTSIPTALEKKARQTVRRNELLAHRYYYFAQIKLLRYDQCLLNLEKENFISGETIVDLLGEVRQTISDLVDTKPTLKDLKQKYPWLEWN